MQSTLIAEQPLFELKGKWNFVDLSAWISGVSFFCGIWMAGFDKVQAQLAEGGWAFWVVTGAIAFFFASILLIQRHMRFSMMANTYGSPQRLTTNGIFQYTRNPIYVAFLVPLASISMFSAMASVAAIDIYVLAMTVTVIRKEERDLLATFGRDFADYAKRVPRWLVWTREPQVVSQDRLLVS
jgi:protein-S-isoprenylcysteine O-methyltransferase Ste14